MSLEQRSMTSIGLMITNIRRSVKSDWWLYCRYLRTTWLTKKWN